MLINVFCRPVTEYKLLDITDLAEGGEAGKLFLRHRTANVFLGPGQLDVLERFLMKVDLKSIYI